MINFKKRRIYRYIFFFILFSLIIYYIVNKIVFRYVGDGNLIVDHTLVPNVHSCNLKFEKKHLHERNKSEKYRFKNVPCSYLEVYLHVDFLCYKSGDKVIRKIDISDFKKEKLNSIDVKVSIYDEYNNYVYISEGKFHVSNNLPGDWIAIHYPEVWRYKDVNLSSFKPRHGREYTFDISIESRYKNRLTNVCIQPFLTSGTPFNL